MLELYFDIATLLVYVDHKQAGKKIKLVDRENVELFIKSLNVCLFEALGCESKNMYKPT